MTSRKKDAFFQGRTPQVVAILPAYIASCQINVVKPLSALARTGAIKFKHACENNASASLIRWADVVIFCRNTEPGYRHLLNEAIARRRPVIYDIDDSFWDIPKETDPDLARYHLQPLRLRQLETYLKYASLVRVYSPLLLAKVSRFNKNSRIYKSSLDFSRISFRDSVESRPKLGIVYATSRTVDDQYRVFLPALDEFMKRHHDKVEMTVWGCSPPELRTLPGVTSKKLIANYDDFLGQFARAGFQVGLAPLSDNEFNRSKNNTKFRDYGACGIAGIYSNVDAYSTSVVDGQDGLLVDNTREAWLTALNHLVFDEELRNRIRQNARDKVYQNYRQDLIEADWLSDIDKLLQAVPPFFNSGRRSDCLSIKIKAQADCLSGIELQDLVSTSTHDKAMVYLELRSIDGNPLRAMASSIANYDAERRSMVFSFDPVLHSQERQFEIRLSGLEKADYRNEKDLSKKVRTIYERCRSR